MKIAFVHAEDEFTTELFNELKEGLGNQQNVSWVETDAARAKDYEITLVGGKFTRQHEAYAVN
jgi:hypothetical protein